MSKKAIIINGHDLIDAMDGVARVDESKRTEIFEFLSKVAVEDRPDSAVVLFDSKLDHPYWKRRRHPQNLSLLKEMIANMGIYIDECEVSTPEAKIREYASQFEKEGYVVHIHANSLISTTSLEPSENIVYIDSMTGKKENLLQLNERLPLSQIREVMSITGLGWRGISTNSRLTESETVKLIQEYGTVKGVYDNLDKLNKRQQRLLRSSKDMIRQAFLNFKLENPDGVRQTKDLKIDLDMLNQYVGKVRKGQLIEPISAIEGYEHSVDVIHNFEKLDRFFNSIAPKSKLLVEVVESNNRVVGVIVAGKERALIRINPCLSYTEAFSELSQAFEDKQCEIITTDSKTLNKHTYRAAGKEVRSCFDIALAGYNLGVYSAKNGGGSKRALTKAFNLPEEQQIDTFETFIRTNFLTSNADLVDDKYVGRYGYKFIEIARELFKRCDEKLNKYPSIREFSQTIEMPLARVLAKMEVNGIFVDKEVLRESEESFSASIKKSAVILNNHGFNPKDVNKPKAVKQMLFEVLGLGGDKFANPDKQKTDADTLLELAKEHPLPEAILHHRKLLKARDTYAVNYQDHINPKTHRIHATFNQDVTNTGRLSTCEPNIQGMPSKGEGGEKIRAAVKSDQDGNVLFSGDYSQIELRVLAHMAGEKTLIRQFSTGEDVHRQTASEIFRVSADEVTDQQRSIAKAINFGIIYGQGSAALAKKVGVSFDEAKKYKRMYFERYGRINEFMEGQIAHARMHGYVKTLTGRIINIEHINSSNRELRAGAERAARNAAIQGTAADIIKLAMIDVDKLMDGDTSKLVSQVHDELVCEIPRNRAKELVPKIVTAMSKAMILEVPLLVEYEIGNNWTDSDEDLIAEIEGRSAIDSKLDDVLMDAICESPRQKRFSDMTIEEIQETLKHAKVSELGMLL